MTKMISKKWSFKCNRCKKCNRTSVKHKAYGLCGTCYSLKRYHTVDGVKNQHRIRSARIRDKDRFCGKRELIIAVEKHCQVCRCSKKLNVHHIDRNRKNNHLSNLTVLCSSCHTSLHNFLRGREKFKNFKNLIR